ncbi:N/A [soil metagenome]
MRKSIKATNDLAPAQGGYEVLASVQTDVGCVREANEDSGRHVRPNDPALRQTKGALTIIADGTGGHASGEVASQMAVEIVSRVYYQAEDDSPTAALKHAVEEANRLIHAASLKDEKLRGMGTTCTALVLRGGFAHCAHVGDSRLYMLRDGEIYLLTEDHSAVMEMVKLGLITPEEARTHEDKNVILRALGTSPEVEVSVWGEPFAVREGDQYLLCSDGLYDLVRDEEIRRALVEAADAHAAGEELIALAQERGGHDNIKVGIVGVVREGAGAVDAEDVRITRELEAVK